MGAPVNIAGLIFSVKGLSSLKRNLAVAGLVLSIIGLIATIGNATLGAYMAAKGDNRLVNKILNIDDKKLINDKSNSDPKKNETGYKGDSDDKDEQDTFVSDNLDPKAEFIEKVVEEAKSGMDLPYKMYDSVTLLDITPNNDSISYYYEFDGTVTDTSSLSNELLRENLLESVCDVSEVSYLLNQDIDIEYNYSINNSDNKFYVFITKSDCQ